MTTMIGFIALPVVFVLGTVGFVLIRRSGRIGRDPWHLLRDMSPVSGQWLADYRRMD